MRFQITEHKALLAEIAFSDLSKESFSFVKKSGLVYVKHPRIEKGFTFYRNSETILNDSNEWEKKVTYYFDKPSKKGVSTDWDGILFAFGIWLKSISA